MVRHRERTPYLGRVKLPPADCWERSLGGEVIVVVMVSLVKIELLKFDFAAASCWLVFLDGLHAPAFKPFVCV